MTSGMRESARVLITRMTEPLARGLSRFGVTPCMLTTTGLLLNIAGAAILVVGSERADGDNLSVLGLGCAVILFAGVFDILDGQVARVGGMSSRFGALYDSALDRYSEFLMFFRHMLLSVVAALLCQLIVGVRSACWIDDGQLRPRPRRGAWGGVRERTYATARAHRDHYRRRACVRRRLALVWWRECRAGPVDPVREV